MHDSKEPVLWIKAATEITKKMGGERQRRGGRRKKERERSKTVLYARQSGKPERNCHSLFKDNT